MPISNKKAGTMNGVPKKMNGVPKKMNGVPKKMNGVPKKMNGVPKKTSAGRVVNRGVTKCCSHVRLGNSLFVAGYVRCRIFDPFLHISFAHAPTEIGPARHRTVREYKPGDNRSWYLGPSLQFRPGRSPAIAVLAGDHDRIGQDRRAAFQVQETDRTVKREIQFFLFEQMKDGDIVLAEPQMLETTSQMTSGQRTGRR